MATGKSGTFELVGNKGITMEISWAETYDVATNKSTVSITKIRVKSTSWMATYYLNGTIKINGTTAITMNSTLGTHNVYTQTLNTYYNAINADETLATGSVSGISHNNDGTKSVDIVVNITGYTTSGGAGNGWNVSATKSVDLYDIPRVSEVTVSASTVEMGDVVTINTNRKADVLTHTLTYSFGGSAGTIATDVSDGYTWRIPVALAANIPEETSAEVTVICTTIIKGSTSVVGTSTATFTATVPNNEETRPKVKMALECIGDLPSKFAGVYVFGKTAVKVTYDASSDYSIIDSYTTMFPGVVGDGNPYTSPLQSNAGQIVITGRVEDKRGYYTTVTDTITVEPYSRPRILPGEGERDIVCKRCKSDGTPDASGAWLLIKIGRKYSPVGNKNTCKLSYRHKTEAAADYSDPIELLAASASSDYVSVHLPNIVPSTTTAYTIQLIAEDDIGESDVVTVTIPTAFATVHLAEGGHGLTVGGYHDESRYDWFICNFNAEFKGEVRGIYASGETDGWTWRKYSDGIAECWRRVSQVVDITNGPKNYMYYGACQDVSFPFVFKAVPVCHTSVECNNILMVGSYGMASTAKPAAICVFKPEDANPEEDLTVVYHAIGRWK